MMAKDKKIKVRFCPKCKSFKVGYIFGLSSWLGMSPRMRCKKCKFEMPSFPVLITSKKKIKLVEKRLKKKTARKKNE